MSSRALVSVPGATHHLPFPVSHHLVNSRSGEFSLGLHYVSKSRAGHEQMDCILKILSKQRSVPFMLNSECQMHILKECIVKAYL